MSPISPMLAMITDAFAGGFGAAAAIVLLGGGVLLRWQRNRLQFTLMQTAIERGVTPMPGAPPLWLLSLRQGVMILILGLGLIAAGSALHKVARQVPMPTFASTQPAGMNFQRPPQRPRQFNENDGPPGFGPMNDDFQDRPPRPNQGFAPGQGQRPGQGPPRRGERGGPGDRLGPDGPDADGPDAGPGSHPPGPPNPPLEAWHRAQDHLAIAMLAMSAGLILALLGLVRIVFAFSERRYAPDAKIIS